MDSRQEGLLDAHQRNIGTRRGGRQARGRTRGIHRGILQVLKERILRVIASQLPGPRVNILNLRVSQIDQRLAFLKHNWAEDKRSVIPGLRAWVLQENLDPVIEVESEEEVETVVYSSGEEGPTERAETDQLPSFSATTSEQRQGGSSSSSSDSRVLRSEPAPASSTSVPKLGQAPKSKASGVVITRSNPLLRSGPRQPTHQSAESAQWWNRIFAEVWHQGQRVPAPVRLTNIPVISIDYHQVLDRVNLSSRRWLRNDFDGSLHPQVVQVLNEVAERFTIIVCSYCHREDTRRNVRTACNPVRGVHYVSISDKPTGERGKLTVLKGLVASTSLGFVSGVRRVYHIDDSDEVLTELKQSRLIEPIGISLSHKPRQKIVDQVQYYPNVFQALEFIADRETAITSAN